MIHWLPQIEVPGWAKAWWIYFAKLVVVFSAYFYTAKVGLSLDAVSGFATLIWAPTGIALASLLLGGLGLWPALAAGAFAINLTMGASAGSCLGIAFGNTLEAVLAAYWLTRFGFHPALDRLKDLVIFVCIGVVAAPVVSATFGVTSLWLSAPAAFEGFGQTWRAWWVGDALGAFVVAPFFCVWGSSWRTLEKREQCQS